MCEALTRVATNLGYTLEELPTVLAAQNIDYAAYREDMRKEITLQVLRGRDVLQRIYVSPREVDQYLARIDRDDHGIVGDAEHRRDLPADLVP